MDEIDKKINLKMMQNKTNNNQKNENEFDIKIKWNQMLNDEIELYCQVFIDTCRTIGKNWSVPKKWLIRNICII